MLRTITLLFVVTIFVVSLAFAQRQTNGKGDSLAALMQEREETLQQVVDIARHNYREGETSLDSLMVDEGKLLDAQLDSASTVQERITILESQLNLARQQEEVVARRVEVANAPPKDLMTAKANRLTVHIALLREKQK